MAKPRTISKHHNTIPLKHTNNKTKSMIVFVTNICFFMLILQLMKITLFWSIYYAKARIRLQQNWISKNISIILLAESHFWFKIFYKKQTRNVTIWSVNRTLLSWVVFDVLTKVHVWEFQTITQPLQIFTKTNNLQNKFKTHLLFCNKNKMDSFLSIDRHISI